MRTRRFVVNHGLQTAPIVPPRGGRHLADNGATERSDEPLASAERAGRGPERLTWRGRAALIVLAVHVALLFFPPVPPLRKGSVWSYVLGYSAVMLSVLEVSRASPWIGAWWRRVGTRRHLLYSYGAAATLLAAGSAMLVLTPELFGRFADEEGLWEPLTLFLYVGSAVLLLRAARGTREGEPAAPLWVAGVAYAVIAAEEVDYLGIFGGLIGRVQGVYVGTPHDLISLWAEGISPPAIVALVLLPLLVAAGFLWRRGYLRAEALRPVTRPLPLLWLVSAVALVAVALAEEAHVVNLVVAGSSPEELLEVGAAVLMAALALELASAAGPPRQ